MNITYNTKTDILEIEPDGSLEEKDFRELGAQIDDVKNRGRKLNGLLIRTKDFPGYQKFSDMFAHGEFVKQNEGKLSKVAISTESKVADLLSVIGGKLSDTEVRSFGYDEKDEAEKWLLN